MAVNENGVFGEFVRWPELLERSRRTERVKAAEEASRLDHEQLVQANLLGWIYPGYWESRKDANGRGQGWRDEPREYAAHAPGAGPSECARLRAVLAELGRGGDWVERAQAEEKWLQAEAYSRGHWGRLHGQTFGDGEEERKKAFERGELARQYMVRRIMEGAVLGSKSVGSN